MMRGSAPLRLLCVSHYFESHRGGIEIVAGQLARSLAAAGVDVSWMASDASPAPNDVPARPLRASNIIERRVGLPFPLPRPQALIRLANAIRLSDAVLVHDGMYATSIAALVGARLAGRPAILVQHIGRVPADSIWMRILFGIADRVLTRSMLRIASRVVYISATSARHFAGVRLRRTPALIFNGVDKETFRPSACEDERAREREESGWPADRPVILFVGRFLEKKGLLRLREMAQARPKLHWAFAGWGPCDPAHWGLPNVSIHRGLSGRGVAALYRAADLLVLPSKSEGFPLVVQEALACGLRAVCCDDGANADPAAARFVTGISNQGSENEIVARYVEAIDALANTADLPASRAARAAFSLERYSWRAAAKRYVGLLNDLCADANERQEDARVPA